MILREVLQLHDAPGPAACAVRSVELEHPADAVVGARAVEHGGVFLVGCFAEGLPDLEDAADLRRDVLPEQGADGRLVEAAGQVYALAGEPAAQLDEAAGVLESGDALRLCPEFFGALGVVGGDVLGHLSVDTDAAVVDVLVERPELALCLSRLVQDERVADLPLGDDVLLVVVDEERPLVGVVALEVASPAAVLLRRSARHAEVGDESLAGFELRLVFGESERLADCIQ